VDEPAEVTCRGPLVPEVRKLVSNEGMVNFDDGAHAYEV